MSNSSSINPQIEKSWNEALNQQFSAPYFLEFKQFLLEEKQKFTIYPPSSHIFSAFNNTPVHKVKAVIIGQDPYHNQGASKWFVFFCT